MWMAAASFARLVMFAGVVGLSLGLCVPVMASPVLEDGSSGALRAEGIPPPYPPIRWAILNGDFREVRRLVAAGEDVDQPLFNGETAAMMAGRADYWNITRYLLEQGSDPAAEDARGDTLAAIARTSRLHPEAPEYRDLEAVRAILRERGLY